jgi:hypothetical protein
VSPSARWNRRLVVARQQPGLVLDVVAERDVGDVVQQRGDPQHAPLVVADAQAGGVARGVAVHGVEQPVAHVQRADRMLEARVHGARVDEVRETELLDAAQPLELGRVDQPHFLGGEFDVAVDGIAQDRQGPVAVGETAQRSTASRHRAMRDRARALRRATTAYEKKGPGPQGTRSHHTTKRTRSPRARNSPRVSIGTSRIGSAKGRRCAAASGV